MCRSITFIPGLFWGWLFHKQKSIVGVSVSHVMLGLWVIFVLGVKGIVVNWFFLNALFIKKSQFKYTK